MANGDPKKTMTVTEDDFADEPSQLKDAATPAKTPPEEPGFFGKVWDRASTGVMSPDTAMRMLTLPEVRKRLGIPEKDLPANFPKPEEGVEGLRRYAKSFPGIGASRTAHVPWFGDIDIDRFHAGMRADEAETVSGMTSPLSLALMLLSGIPGGSKLAPAARGLLTASGLGFGLQGAKNVVEGVGRGVMTPEGMQQTLGGASNILAAAPDVQQLGRGLKEFPGMKIAPGTFSTGEKAFIQAMQPPKKRVDAARRAFNTVEPELQQAHKDITDFEDMVDFTDKKKAEIVAETNAMLMKRSPTAGNINSRSLYKAINDEVLTPWMGLRMRERVTSRPNVPRGGEGALPGAAPSRTFRTEQVLPREGQMLMNEAKHIERNIRKNGLSLVEAEMAVKNLNALLTDFYKLPPETQWQVINVGHNWEIPLMRAVKNALQAQIEAKVPGYKFEKGRYGAYKEIGRLAQERIDAIEKQEGRGTYSERRAMEALGAGLGSLFSGEFINRVGTIYAGRAAGAMAGHFMSNPVNQLRRAITPPPPPVNLSGEFRKPGVAALSNQNRWDSTLDELFPKEK